MSTSQDVPASLSSGDLSKQLTLYRMNVALSHLKRSVPRYEAKLEHVPIEAVSPAAKGFMA